MYAYTKKLIFICSVILPSIAFCLEEQVPDVIVSADSFSNPSHYTFRSPTTMTKKEIQASGAHNVSDLLKGNSDIQFRQLYEGSPIAPSMRGFGDNANSNVLILINGMPISYSDMGAVMLDTIPLNEIEEISILSGSGGVLYGDQAVGGVINITSPQLVGAHYHSALMGGSYDSFKYNLGASYPISESLTAAVDGQYYTTDNYREHNHFKEGNADIGLNKQYSSGFFQINYRYYVNDLQYSGALTAEQIAENRRQSQNNTDFDNQKHQDMYWQWKQIINDDYFFNQGLLIQTMRGDGVLTNPFAEQRNLVETNPTLLGAFTLREKPVHYQVGALLQYSSYILQETPFSDNSSQYKEAAFTQFVLALTKQLHFTAGIRGAQSQSRLLTNTWQRAINSAVISELGLEWKLLRYLKFYLRRAGNYRFPKAEENALSKDQQPLKTQTGVSYETGLLWQEANQKFILDLYQLNLVNEIMYVPTLSGLFGDNENLPPTWRFGGSAKYEISIDEKWKIGVNYSYVDARFRSGPNHGKQIPFVAANKSTIHVNYHFLPHWYFQVETILLGSQFPDGDVDSQGAKLMGYGVANVSLRYQYKAISIIATVNNITNVRYNNFAQVVQSGPVTQTFYYPAPTRNFWLSVSFEM